MKPAQVEELKRRVFRDVIFLVRSIETLLPGVSAGTEAQLYTRLLNEGRSWWKVLATGEDANCEVCTVADDDDEEC